jgi:hypothetical protein
LAAVGLHALVADAELSMYTTASTAQLLRIHPAKPDAAVLLNDPKPAAQRAVMRSSTASS